MLWPVMQVRCPSLPSTTATSKPHACSFRIPTAIFATFAHLVSARECGNEASHVTLSAVEVQQVVARLTTMEVINVAPPPAITDAARVGTKMPSRHPRWDLHRATLGSFGVNSVLMEGGRACTTLGQVDCALRSTRSFWQELPPDYSPEWDLVLEDYAPPRCWSLSVPAQRRLPQSHTEVGRCCCRAGWMPVRMLPAVAGPVCRYPCPALP